ncbi:hypothetical protein KDK88_08600, partial [bacterium]|nr:hypothetical protein [bacterium]
QFAVVGDTGAAYGSLPASLMEAKALAQDLADAIRVPLSLEAADSQPFLRSGQQWRLRAADGREVGWVGALAPAVQRAFDLDVPIVVGSWNLADTDLTPTPARYEPFSRYPAAKRDLSLVVPDGVSYAAIDAVLREHGGPLLQSWELFDHFRGGSLPAGTASLGIRLQFQSAKGSLKGKAVEMAVDAVRSRLEGDLGVTIRA